MASPKPFLSIPGPKLWPVVGSALQYTALGPHTFERLHEAKRAHFAKYGAIYREKFGPVTLVQVFDPEDAARVLRADGRYPHRPPLPITLTAHRRDNLLLSLGSLNGVEWHQLRTCVQKLMMHPMAARGYLPAQNKVADDFLKLILNSVDSCGEVSNLYQRLLHYTMESIGTVCFNTRLGCLESSVEFNSVARHMLTASSAMFESVQKTMFSFPWYAIFRTPLYKQFISAKRSCDQIATSFVQETMDLSSPGEEGPNFLSSLVALKTLTPKRTVGITTELFTAGIDSTANALAFVLYNLARHPDKQTTLAIEICSLLPEGAAVTHDVIDQMTYLKACVRESFRINFPVEGGTIRITGEDLVLGGYSIPKGTHVALNHQTMCLQHKYFDQAEAFIPERWLKICSASYRAPPKFVLLPFGHGPRMCIGRRFAEQEIYLAVIKIVGAYLVEYKHEPIGMLNRVFTMPDKPLRLNFTPRQRQPSAGVPDCDKQTLNTH